MEIRRKVFSLLEDERGEERLYSTNEFELVPDQEENEKLFSTGDSELDDILEEVYYSGIEDGYAYFQSEFAEKEKKKDKKRGKISAGGASAVLVGGGTGALIGGQLASKKVLQGGQSEANKVLSEQLSKSDNILESATKKAKEHVTKVADAQTQAERKAGNFLGEWVERFGKNKRARQAAEHANEIIETGVKDAAKEASIGKSAYNKIIADSQETAQRLGRKSKIAAAGLITAGGLVTAGHAIANKRKLQKAKETSK